MPTGEEIQTALTNAGLYSGKVDGVIGSDTTEAIRKFQQASGLNADGVVGSRTWDKLKEHLVEDKTLEKTLEVKN
jgi:peptidoglycan hydrolase-like protein with peptidoglycan-binding domain